MSTGKTNSSIIRSRPMADVVYAVVSGDYSDYQVHAVFTDYDVAEDYADQFNRK